MVYRSYILYVGTVCRRISNLIQISYGLDPITHLYLVVEKKMKQSLKYKLRFNKRSVLGVKSITSQIMINILI